MDPSAINWLAVVAATLAFYGIGAIWYSFLFRDAWIKASGVVMDGTQKVNMLKIMSLTLLLTFIMVTNLAFFVSGPGVTASNGALYGFLTGFGWVAMAMALTSLYENRSWKYMAINGGYMAVGFTVSGLILGAWK